MNLRVLLRGWNHCPKERDVDGGIKSMGNHRRLSTSFAVNGQWWFDCRVALSRVQPTAVIDDPPPIDPSIVKCSTGILFSFEEGSSFRNFLQEGMKRVASKGE